MLLDRYLVKQFTPIFFVAVSMFVLLLSLIDLFANLWRYLNYEVPLSQIMLVCAYYLPKSLSYSLPISILFAAAYTLGDLYVRNELTSIFSSGIPLHRFILPLLGIGALVSCFSFFFDDRIVIPTLKIKTTLSRTLLHQQVTENDSDIVIKARQGELTYSIDYYDRDSRMINGVTIIEQGPDGRFLSLVRAPWASWNGEFWDLSNAIMYEWIDGVLKSHPLDVSSSYTEDPETFARNSSHVEELPAADAFLLVRDLQTAGLPYANVLADYYHRFSFPAVSFVVIILSVSMSGRFKKNILLMSLLSSLAIAVLFYIMEMISMMMARMGYIPPLIGAWFPVGAFIVMGREYERLLGR
ncbi:membrane protein [Spirochaetia bacterium]|nr:membrane protein [Spirochaetia bacterium]